jgi:hypothetical protein
MISTFRKLPMAHLRASIFTQTDVESPKDLVRFGNSSKARMRAEAEWFEFEIVANIRKICLSRAVCNFSSTGRMSDDPGTGAVNVATISSLSIASASAASASSVPVLQKCSKRIVSLES